MYYVIQIDNRGRIIIPWEIRRKVGIKPRDKIIIRLRADNIIELIPFNKLYKEVSEVFKDKFKDWREEDHEATKLLMKMVR